jgi:hypothetical protein
LAKKIEFIDLNKQKWGAENIYTGVHIYIYVFQQNFQEQKNSTFKQKNFNLLKE